MPLQGRGCLTAPLPEQERLVMPTALEIVTDIDRLASMPAVYHRVKQVIDDPNGSMGRLAEAMATDPAMTARILRIVNSPYYGYPGHIDTISRALSILGMQQVHDLVLAWAISATFVGIRPALMSMDSYWRNSVARAVAARQLAKRARFVNTERLFVEGLLSNIGHLVMYFRAPELAARRKQYGQADRGAPSRGRTPYRRLRLRRGRCRAGRPVAAAGVFRGTPSMPGGTRHGRRASSGGNDTPRGGSTCRYAFSQRRAIDRAGRPWRRWTSTRQA